MDGRLAAILGAGLLLAGCAENGSEVDAGQASAHFRTHRAQYERIVALVDACRPTREGGGAAANRVWADRSSSGGLTCRRPGQEIAPIVQALKAAGVVSVSYASVEGPNAPPDGEIQTVSICVYSAGLSVSGTAIDFIYSFQPLDRLPPDDEGDGYGVRRAAVQGPPHHWYWERSWT